MPVLSLLVYIFYAYLLVGSLFAGWFVITGMHRLDPASRTARWPTRLLFIPGALLLWPVLLGKLLFRKDPPS